MSDAINTFGEAVQRWTCCQTEADRQIKRFSTLHAVCQACDCPVCLFVCVSVMCNTFSVCEMRGKFNEERRPSPDETENSQTPHFHTILKCSNYTRVNCQVITHPSKLMHFSDVDEVLLMKGWKFVSGIGWFYQRIFQHCQLLSEKSMRRELWR